MKALINARNIIVSFTIFILIWFLIYTAGDFSPALFPSPAMTFKTLWGLIKDGSLFVNIFASMYRFLTGYILAVVVAVILGLLLGLTPKVFQFVNPIVQLLRPISPMAWMPFIVLWFGIGDIPAIVIIFIAAFFPVLLSTVSSVAGIDETYFKVAKSFGIKFPEILYKIVLPAGFPGIANGIHLALGTAWVFLVAGEMVGSQSGLGYLIIDARNNLRADILMATIIVIGLIGLLLDCILKTLEKLLLKNRK